MSSIRGVNVGGNLFDVTDSSNVAPIQLTNFATRRYTKDRCFIMADGLLYRATAEIESGDPIVINGNCKRTTLDEIISVIETYSDLIAPTEDGATSSANYAVGNEIVRSGVLYKVISAITQGDAFAIGSNIDIAGSLTSQIQTLITNKQDQTLATPTTIDNVSRTTVQDALSALTDSNRVVNNLTSLSTTKSLAARQGKSLRDGMTSIDITGSTNTSGNTIRKGNYFYLNGSLVRATADIAGNATLTENTNYVNAPTGGFNDITANLFKNTSFVITRGGSKVVNFSNSSNGFLMGTSQHGECCFVCSFIVDSGGYVAHCYFSHSAGQGTKINITDGTNQLTITNNDTSVSVHIGIIMFNGNVVAVN